MRHPRLAIASLALSAVGLVSLALEEDFAGKAKIPVPGDVPTLGFGSTKREDGSPVQMGDTTTPPKALARTLAHIQKDEAGLKRWVKGRFGLFAPASHLVLRRCVVPRRPAQ